MMDADLAFEMLEMLFCDSVEWGDRDRFDDLVEKLRERRPDAYAEEEASRNRPGPKDGVG